MASRHSIAVVLLALLAAHTVDAAARLVPSAAAAVAAELPVATPAAAPAAAAAAAAPAAPAIEVRHSVHPEALPSMGSKELRRHFLVDRLFAPGQVALTYTHEDRMIVGGATPLPGAPLALPSDRAIAKSIGRPTFLASRELAAINVGGPGRVVADGAAFDLAPLDALYVPMGTSAVKFESTDKDRPAKFYLLSCPAHKQHAAAKISPRNATKVVTAGAGETANNRTLYHLVAPGGIDSDQITFGVTFLADGSVWNTMPAHLHDRRSEIYMYFNMAPDTRVVHLMGEPDETRHIMVANEQAVVSPSWSIHSGAGTAAYSFVWAMCGENRLMPDIEPVAMATLQ